MADALMARFGRAFPAGVVLFREGEPGAEMFVLQSGLVQVSKRVGQVERPIATFGRGEFLGEMAILNNKPRTATATVLEDATCLVIDAQTLELMVARNAEIAMRLIKKLAARLDAADGLVQILLNPDPKARLLLGLKRHAEAFGEPEGEGIRVRVSVEALAAEVGVTLEQAEEVFARLRRMHIAEASDEGITLANVGKLLDFLEFLEMPRRFDEAARPGGRERGS
jgi:CRP-like cAMP-binding protein